MELPRTGAAAEGRGLLTTPSSSDARWEIGGRFVITGETREEAENAMRALDRAGARAAASVDIYVHASDPAGERP